MNATTNIQYADYFQIDLIFTPLTVQTYIVSGDKKKT